MEVVIPIVLKDLVSKPQGLIMVTGPTGSGKTTTLASLVQHINENFKKRIITIEDPIEFVYADAKSAINQREIGNDTANFAQALRRALRQDPDVILMGELRDAETISTAITGSTSQLQIISGATSVYSWAMETAPSSWIWVNQASYRILLQSRRRI